MVPAQWLWLSAAGAALHATSWIGLWSIFAPQTPELGILLIELGSPVWPFLDVLELAPTHTGAGFLLSTSTGLAREEGTFCHTPSQLGKPARMDEAQPDQGNHVIISYSTNKDNGGTLKEALAHSSSGATRIMRTFPAIQEAEG